jgi:hypothetical protein
MSTVLTFKHSIGPGVRIQFSRKPDARIRGMLKASSFRWSPASGEWWRSRLAGAADFLAALDRALNPGKPHGRCWDCGAPEGFFRPYGAATPVYCNRCNKAHKAAHDKQSGLCPVCGKQVIITGGTKDGRLIGACKDAFSADQWLAPDDGADPMGVDRAFEDQCRVQCGL